MNDDDTTRLDQGEETILSNEVPDEVVEAVAGSTRERAGALTLAFCSGLDTCPS